MRTRTKILISAMVVGVLGSIAALGIFGVFTASTQNTGNELTAGTVSISDNDAGQAMFNVNGARPGDSWTRCIKVTYTGSLPSDVHLNFGGTLGSLAQYLNAHVEDGTASQADAFPLCDHFVTDQTLYDGPVQSGTGGFDTGLPTYPAGQSSWSTGSSVVYRITASLSSSTPDAGQSQSTGNLTVFWDAQNQ
jgi:hypothetical protein